MKEFRITDDVELAQANERRTRGALALADMLTTDPTEKAAALITAAAVIIEGEVGAAMAPAALMALIEPTMAEWQGAPLGAAHH